MKGKRKKSASRLSHELRAREGKVSFLGAKEVRRQAGSAPCRPCGVTAAPGLRLLIAVSGPPSVRCERARQAQGQYMRTGWPRHGGRRRLTVAQGARREELYGLESSGGCDAVASAAAVRRREARGTRRNGDQLELRTRRATTTARARERARTRDSTVSYYSRNPWLAVLQRVCVCAVWAWRGGSTE